jgi:hypothetical protein
MIAGDMLRGVRSRLARSVGLRSESGLGRLGSTILVFALVAVAWVFFRAASFHDAIHMLRSIFIALPSDLVGIASGHRTFLLSPTSTAVRFAAVAAMLAIEELDRRRGLFDRLAARPAVVRFAVYFFLTYSVLFAGLFGRNAQFIYFQF